MRFADRPRMVNLFFQIEANANLSLLVTVFRIS